MSIVVNVNGESINYPQIGDTEWGVNATAFAVQASSAFDKVGLSTGTTVDLPGTLDVTGNTTLDANLSVGGNASVTGNTTIAGTLGISNGTVSSPSLTPSSDTNTGLYSIGADKIGFAANGSRVGEFGVGYGGFTGNIIKVVRTVGNSNYSFSSSTTITDLNTTFTPIYSNSLIIITVEGYFDSTASVVTPGVSIEIIINGVSRKINSYGGQSLTSLTNSMTMSYSEILTSNAPLSITINCAPVSGTNACILYGSTPGRMHYLTVMEIQK